MEKRIFNFSAGPAVLPEPVLKKAQEELFVYPGAGASVMEISHRSKTFAAILEKTKANMKTLLGVPDNYSILFAPGGATLQFSMLAMNFLNGASADYIMTGSWASKASGEAKKHGTVRPIWSGKKKITYACRRAVNMPWTRMRRTCISPPTRLFRASNSSRNRWRVTCR
jgi:phosphoserine aminotransferase